jgi:hypothetical protein
MDDLITDYTAFGVKVAGLLCWVFYGTREVIAALPSRKGGGYARIAESNGGGLGCSSDESRESGRSKGPSQFMFYP